MSDALRYDPGCSYCYRDIKHTWDQHQQSLAWYHRYLQMRGEPPAPEPPELTVTEKRIRLSQICERRDGIENCITTQEAQQAQCLKTLDFLRQHLEIANAEIAILLTELETSQ